MMSTTFAGRCSEPQKILTRSTLQRPLARGMCSIYSLPSFNNIHIHTKCSATIFFLLPQGSTNMRSRNGEGVLLQKRSQQTNRLPHGKPNKTSVWSYRKCQKASAYLVLWNSDSLCSPGQPLTHGPPAPAPASAPRELRLQACAMVPGWASSFEMKEIKI